MKVQEKRNSLMGGTNREQIIIVVDVVAAPLLCSEVIDFDIDGRIQNVCALLATGIHCMSV
jgi:hypothetical protein